MFSFVPVLQEGHLYLPLRDGSLGHVDMEDVGEVGLYERENTWVFRACDLCHSFPHMQLA